MTCSQRGPLPELRRATLTGTAVALCIALMLVPDTAGIHAKSTTEDAPAAIPVHAEIFVRGPAEASDVAIWRNPRDPSRSVILGANADAGLEMYALDGRRLGGSTSIEPQHVTLVHGYPLRGQSIDLVLADDRRTSGIVAFQLEPGGTGLSVATARPISTNAEITGLCAYRSPLSGRHYVFAATDEGHLQQWELYENDGKVDGALVRTIPIGFGAGYCAVDETDGTLYITEETVGIWKLAGEPESDAERTLVDLTGPRGRLAEEVKGIALYRVDATQGYLLAADVGSNRLNVYSLQDSAYLGSVSVQTIGSASALEEAEGLAALSVSLGKSLPAGAVLFADEKGSGAGPGYKLLAWEAIADALRLQRAQPSANNSGRPSALATVMPTVETDPVDDYGDAADDPAIWVHPTDPAKSLIIGTQKKRGLYVYDLSGKTLQVIPDGRMNNVDLRYGFELQGERVAIVAASNRTRKSLALYKVDPVTRQLVDVADGTIPTGFRDPYGLCMYHSARSGEFHVFMNDSDSGAYKQWRLVAKGDRVAAEQVREFVVGSQAEGCAADDETGALYIAEEDVGLWRYEAEPTAGTQRIRIDSTRGGNLKADVEGVAIYYGPNGTGYLVVSNQGADNYAVYRREGQNAFVGHFAIVANPRLGIDGASETDGLDVTSTPLGPAFPHGLLVVQDGRNISPAARQNFKLVPWEQVASALSLGAPR